MDGGEQWDASAGWERQHNGFNQQQQRQASSSSSQSQPPYYQRDTNVQRVQHQAPQPPSQSTFQTPQRPPPSQGSSNSYRGSVGSSTFNSSTVRRIFDLDLPLVSDSSSSIRMISSFNGCMFQDYTCDIVSGDFFHDWFEGKLDLDEEDQFIAESLDQSPRSERESWMSVRGAEGKLRPSDDCLEAQINFAYTSSSYLKLQDVDYVSGLALRIASSVAGGKQKSGSGRWLGKCLDLSKAYKQMGALPDHRYLSEIFFHDISGKPRFDICNSLMFGATAAVYSFNRVSRSLWFLMNRMLLIPCGVFL